MAIVNPEGGDINQYIFRANKEEVEPQETTDKYYTMFGDHDYLDTEGNPRVEKESKKILARSYYSEKSSFGGISVTEKYLIKIGVDGKIFDPSGMYSEGKQNKFLSKIGKKQFNLKEVNVKVFNLYLSFLRTKNKAWLNNAERELL